jgi:predicted small integral membrane protein
MSTFEGGAESWQATRNPVVVWLGALFIAGAKAVTAVLCAAGAIGMLRAHRAAGDAFGAARRTALVGCGVAVLMLFAGFTVVAESWFELWRSDALRGPVLDSSLRYAAMIALIGLFVAAPEA